MELFRLFYPLNLPKIICVAVKIAVKSDDLQIRWTSKVRGIFLCQGMVHTIQGSSGSFKDGRIYDVAILVKRGLDFWMPHKLHNDFGIFPLLQKNCGKCMTKGI